MPVRKQGKLPGKCISVTYQLEYGSDTFECQEGSIPQGATVVIIDDLIVSRPGPLGVLALCLAMLLTRTTFLDLTGYRYARPLTPFPATLELTPPAVPPLPLRWIRQGRRRARHQV